MTTASRYHDISTGHRVHGHENKCKHLHGHNYRVHFHVEGGTLDNIGRVLDFGVIKSALCLWLEDNWDHRFLVFQNDPHLAALQAIDPEGVVAVPFNPTAENMAEYLVQVIGPQQLKGTGVRLATCTIEETRKCSASHTLNL